MISQPYVKDTYSAPANIACLATSIILYCVTFNTRVLSKLFNNLHVAPFQLTSFFYLNMHQLGYNDALEFANRSRYCCRYYMGFY